MTERQRELLATIEAAFAGVKLGEGVSLHETEVIDMYGSEEEHLAARNRDEQDDWRRLIDSPDLIEVCGIGGLCFYDSEGLRFHLPAYLSRAVISPHDEQAGAVYESLIFNLTSFDKFQLERFAILDVDQKRCIRDVLIYLRDEWELERPEIELAINQYWSLGTGPNRGDQRTPLPPR